jgi:hypothetical protein
MNKPLVVLLPHNLGQEEATRRLRGGLSTLSSQFGALFLLEEQTWCGHHFQFRVKALGQHASGAIEVGENQVRLEVALPWILARLAQTAQTVITQRGALLLDRK